jgi:predicted ATPase
MITRIEVNGFKSLDGFALDLETFSALIGPNGAGKSNILDALGLLSRMASGDLATALQKGRGRIREQFSRLDPGPVEVGSGPLGHMALAVEVLLLDAAADALATRLRYEVTLELQLLSSGIERCVVHTERLLAMDQAGDPWMTRRPGLARYARHGARPEILSYERGELTIDDPGAPHASAGEPYRVTPQHVAERCHLADPRAYGRSPHLHAVAEELRQIRVVQLEPRLLREPSERGAPAMTAEGEHLAKALAALPPGGMARVRAALAGLVPGARTVETLSVDDAFHVEIEFSDGRRFPSRVLSDGTLRVLGLATLMEVSPAGAVLAIEEPENGVHPSRARALVELLRDATRVDALEAAAAPRQVLITSHSPVVLAALMDAPDSIAFIDMVRQGDGPRRTRARHLAAQGGDRGRSTVSVAEIERLLSTARFEEDLAEAIRIAARNT